jgi:hypothetical protein
MPPNPSHFTQAFATAPNSVPPAIRIAPQTPVALHMRSWFSHEKRQKIALKKTQVSRKIAHFCTLFRKTDEKICPFARNSARFGTPMDRFYTWHAPFLVKKIFRP